MSRVKVVFVALARGFSNDPIPWAIFDLAPALILKGIDAGQIDQP